LWTAGVRSEVVWYRVRVCSVTLCVHACVPVCLCACVPVYRALLQG
jgi:hypothetical protein